jgi:diacylglycerol kinase (ATP)
MGKPGHTGLKRILHAAGYSASGLRAAWRHESAFRQELLLLAIGAPLGWWLAGNGVERALLIGSLLIVLIVELLNSAIEAAIDRIDDREHPLSARAKDLGSAAVLLSLSIAAVVWALVLIP